VKLKQVTARRSAISIVCGACLVPLSAGAQQPGAADSSDDAGAALQEITVTAEHRTETLQKTAASIDVVGQAQLAAAGVQDVSDLTKLVPALTSLPFVGPYANFTIRGMSNYATNDFNENTIVVNEAGVPLVHPTGAHGLFYDLERVEVLKGPQGTQYGRNATGGVINVIPAAPTQTFGFYIDGDVGNFDEHNVQGAINVPLSDTLAARLAFNTVRRHGYFDDGTSDEHSDAGRLSLRYAPVEELSATLILDIDHDAGLGNGSALLNSNGVGFLNGTPWAGVNTNNSVFNNYWTANHATPRQPFDTPFEDNTFWGATVDIEWLTPFGNLTVLPAHRDVQLSYLSDLPTFYTAEDNQSKQDSIEMRLASSDEHALRYLLGAFYLKDTLTGHSDVEQPPNLTNSYLDMGTRTAAVFGQLTYAITDAFRLSGSARFNQDHKTTNDFRSTLSNFPFLTTPVYPLSNQTGTGPFAVNAEQTWNSGTWKGGVEYDLAHDSLLYFNVGTGFKAGGFFFGPPGRDSFAPEKVTAYTLGEKSRFLDDKLQVNAEAYWLDYKDQQIAHIAVVPGFGNVNVVDNVGHAKIKGLDLDAKYLVTRYTSVNLSGSFEHAEYDSFNYLSATNVTGQVGCPVTKVANGYDVNCSGQDMPQAPGLVVQGGLDQTLPLPGGASLLASGDFRHEQGHQTSTSFVPQAVIPSYTRGDVSLTYQASTDNWSLQAYCENVANSTTIESVIPGRSFNDVSGGLISAILLPPRTYGLRVHYKY
jgi:iron complex outermembrane recepter protein